MREARIDLHAVRSNLAASDPSRPVDVSGDAYGHGALVVARVAADLGRSLGVRDEHERRLLAEHGFAAEVLPAHSVGSHHAAAVYGIGRGAAVMRVSARVISLKRIAKGDAVSYGYTWRAPAATTLALVPLGYADGVTRAAGNLCGVEIGGVLRPIVGRVAMDVCVAEVGDDPTELGAEAVLFGSSAEGHQTVSAWARQLGLTPLEVTHGMGARIPRTVA